jgi:hypothetical protein
VNRVVFGSDGLWKREEQMAWQVPLCDQVFPKKYVKSIQIPDFFDLPTHLERPDV